MNENKKKVITRVGVWIAAIVGSIPGLIYLIGGYLLDWGPGGSMQGPFWRVLLVGLPCALLGAYAGELIVRIISKASLSDRWSSIINSIRAFIAVFLGCLASIVVAFEVGALLGKITGAIEGLEWDVLINAPMMGLAFGIPFSLAVGILFGAFVFIYTRKV